MRLTKTKPLFFLLLLCSCQSPKDTKEIGLNDWEKILDGSKKYLGSVDAPDALSHSNVESYKKKIITGFQPYVDEFDKNAPNYDEVVEMLSKASEKFQKTTEKSAKKLKVNNF